MRRAEAQLERAVKRGFKPLIDFLLRNWERELPLSAIAASESLEGLPEALRFSIGDAEWERFSPEMAREIASALGVSLEMGAEAGRSDLTGILVDWSLQSPEAIEWTRSWSLDLVKGLQQTTRDGLRNTLATGLELGESRDELAKRIQALVQDIPAWRSRLIAQTECLPGSTIIRGAKATAVYRRWYEGDLIEIETRSGNKFSGTPNHPMLTTKGWVALNCITEGDGIIRYGFGDQSNSFGDPYVKDEPTTLAEIFSSLHAIGSPQREFTINEDFHGDGREGYVDVLRSDGLLWIGGLEPLDEGVNYQGLTPSEFAQVLFSARRYTSIKGIRTSQCISVGFAPQTNASAGKISGNPFAINAHDLANGGQGHPRFIEPDGVVNIKWLTYSGHVYNLSTIDGYFSIAHGLITGNTIRAYSQGSLQVYRASGVTERKKWLDGQAKACPYCRALDGQIIGLEENFEGGVDGPPRHPGCVCAIRGIVFGAK